MLWLLLLVVVVGLGGVEGVEEGCYPYYLDNECGDVVGWTEFDEEEQIERYFLFFCFCLFCFFLFCFVFGEVLFVCDCV